MPSAQPPQNSLAPSATPVVDQAKVSMEHKKALLQKVRLLRANNMSKGEITDKDPSKEYIWVNIKEERQHFFQAWGYQVCTGASPNSPFKQADGRHLRADVILYQIDKDLYEAIQADNQLRGIEGIEGHKQAAIATMNRMGVREYEPRV